MSVFSALTMTVLSLSIIEGGEISHLQIALLTGGLLFGVALSIASNTVPDMFSGKKGLLFLLLGVFAVIEAVWTLVGFESALYLLTGFLWGATAGEVASLFG